MDQADAPLAVWTVGHSTLTLGEFLDLLAAHGIRTVADVRSFPGSRRLPHFGRAALAAALAEAGIAYQHLPGLGGRRRPRPDSPNTGWRVAAFRAYADHLASAEFRTGLARLLAIARGSRSAMMCAEAVWWRCHRRIIADVLVARGVPVFHILGLGAAREHVLAPPAWLVDGHVRYDGLPV